MITLVRSIDQDTFEQLKTVKDRHLEERDSLSMKIHDWFVDFSQYENPLDQLRNKVLVDTITKLPLIHPVIVKETGCAYEKTIIELSDLRIDGKPASVIPHAFAEEILAIINKTNSMALVPTETQIVFKSSTEMVSFQRSLSVVVNTLVREEILRMRLRSRRQELEESVQLITTKSNAVLASTNAIIAEASQAAARNEIEIASSLASAETVRQDTDSMVQSYIAGLNDKINTNKAEANQAAALAAAREQEIQNLRATLASIK